MAVDPYLPRPRRALIAAALGAAAASIAQAIGRPAAVSASDPNDVVLGGFNSSTISTIISVPNDTAFTAISTNRSALVATSENVNGIEGLSASGSGVYGASTSGPGVEGQVENATETAALGWNYGAGTGVHGFSANFGTARPATLPKTGVQGRCDLDASSYGVFGHSSIGTGTRGNTTSGTGLLGVATGAAGFGLRSIGRLSFQKASGVGTIANGASSVTVTPGTDVVSGTFVILTAQADPGTRRLWATTDPVANTITIHVSSAVAANLKVAWLAIG